MFRVHNGSLASWRIGFAVPFVFLVLSSCTPGGGSGGFLEMLEGKIKVPDHAVLELSLKGELRDGLPDSPFQELADGGVNSLWRLRQALDSAARDTRIEALLLQFDSPQLGFGEMQELSGLLDRFRASGKPVVAHLGSDFADDRVYYLALSADKILTVPQTALFVNGFRAEVTFWRGALEKLGIVPNVLMFKEYKSAGEPFSRYSMSDAFREAIQGLLDEFQATLEARISLRRAMLPVQVKAGLSLGLMTGSEALKTGWIDGFASLDEVKEVVMELASHEEYNGVSMKTYLRAVRTAARRPKFRLGKQPPKVAVVFGEGPIVASEREEGLGALMGGAKVFYGPEVARNIEAAGDAEDVAVIVFRVNSPGGSAVGSEAVHAAIEKVRAKGKKVVVSMSSYAASGGYWVSMGADRIVAQPTTITGSIGVVFMSFDVRGFYDWIGAHVDTLSSTPGAGILSSVEDFEGKAKERMTAWMGEVYDVFKSGVSEGRNLSADEVEERARGRVWTGRAALKRGLVDELGGMDTAIAAACKLAKLGDPSKVTVEAFPKKDLMSQIFGEIFGANLKLRAASARTPFRHWSGISIDRQLIRLLKQPRVLALAPWIEIQ